MWQLGATTAMVLAAWLMADMTSALSAAAGGAVSMLAGLASVLVASLSNPKSAGAALAGALRAEAVRLCVAFALAWLALANYPKAAAAFLGALVVTMLIFSMAFFVRDY